MVENKKLKTILFFVIFFFFFSFSNSFADEGKITDLEAKRQELDKLYNEILDQKYILEEKRKEVATLETEIELLEIQIKETETAIQKAQLEMESLQVEINNKREQIKAKEEELKKKKVILAEYIRLIHKFDQISLIESVFSQSTFEGFLVEIQYLDNLQEKVFNSLKEIQWLKFQLETERDSLLEKQEEQSRLYKMQEMQKLVLESTQKNKQELLEKTKGEEDQFQKVVDDLFNKQSLIAKEISCLVGNDEIPPSLEQIYSYATFASAHTGVRRELILAVISQESNLGRNVGSGYYKDEMEPRYWPVFESICLELNIDPEIMKISKKPSSYPGWGGAMGPGQIMPYKWLRVKSNVAEITGHNPPSPWNLQDAFVATGVILQGLGAANQTYETEYEAVGKYFAGSNWRMYTWYSDMVMEKTKIF